MCSALIDGWATDEPTGAPWTAGLSAFRWSAWTIRRAGLNRTAWLLLVIAVVVASVSSGSASTALADRVRTTHGTETGEVTDMTPLEITLDRGTPGIEKVPVNEVRSVVFDNEPSSLTQARVNAHNGGYQTALDALSQIDLESIRRDVVRQDVEYYRAYCAAQLALGGEGKILDAGRQLNTFVRTYPQNYHYLEAVETMGDLLMATGKYSSAQKQYDQLARAPWPEYRLRAAVLVARTLQAQDKHAEAVAEFDKVLANPNNDDGVVAQKLSAILGKAVSLAETGHTDEAVGMIESVIRDADPEQKQLLARTYNVLGDCYQRSGKTKDALLAYLHVDLLYNTVPDAHAEALSHLVELWRAVGQDESAREARQTLQERYGNSRWARSTQ